MHAIEHLIDPNQQQIGGIPVQHCQIIPERHAHEIACGLLLAQPSDEIKFAGHGGIVLNVTRRYEATKEYLLLTSRQNERLRSEPSPLYSGERAG